MQGVSFTKSEWIYPRINIELNNMFGRVTLGAVVLWHGVSSVTHEHISFVVDFELKFEEMLSLLPLPAQIHELFFLTPKIKIVKCPHKPKMKHHV